MEQAIGIIGQAILLLVGLCVVLMLVSVCLAVIRAIRRLLRELRTPLLPYTDAYLPPPYDQP